MIVDSIVPQHAQTARSFPATRLASAKLATRLSFFLMGFAAASWAPLVPFAKDRIGANTSEFGVVLLCLGLGSLVGMPAAGVLSGRLGCRSVIMAGAIGTAIALPLLGFAPHAVTLGFALFMLGGSLGFVDVAANIHGTEVQNEAGVPLMSGFHGMYSVGGLVGAVAVTVVVASGAHTVVAASAASAVVIACLTVASRRFLATRISGDCPLLAMPHGKVAIIGLLAFIMFLSEAAVLDWSAILLIQTSQVGEVMSGVGYAAFATTMTLGRLIGDRVVSLTGNRLAIISGSLMAGAGIVLATSTSTLGWTLCGFALMGLGAANVVPVLFTLAGQQKRMPASDAIAAISVAGYSGVLMGPAIIGYVAGGIGLDQTFKLLAILMGFVMLLAPLVASRMQSFASPSRQHYRST